MLRLVTRCMLPETCAACARTDASADPFAHNTDAHKKKPPNNGWTGTANLTLESKCWNEYPNIITTYEVPKLRGKVSIIAETRHFDNDKGTNITVKTCARGGVFVLRLRPQLPSNPEPLTTKTRSHVCVFLSLSYCFFNPFFRDTEGSQENVFQLSPAALAKRKVVHLDISDNINTVPQI